MKIPIKIQCSCGQKYAFDAEPVNGRMPQVVNCPVCGADGTAAANQIISQHILTQAPAIYPSRQASPVVNPTESRPSVSTPPKKKNKLLIPAIVGGVLLLATVGASLVFWPMRYLQTKKENVSLPPEALQNMGAASSAADENKQIFLARQKASVGETNQAIEILDKIVASKNVRPVTLNNAAAIYVLGMENFSKGEEVFTRLTEVTPNAPQAWYYLAAARAVLGKQTEAQAALKTAQDLNNKQMAATPNAKGLLANSALNPNYRYLLEDPRFKALLK